MTIGIREDQSIYLSVDGDIHQNGACFLRDLRGAISVAGRNSTAAARRHMISEEEAGRQAGDEESSTYVFYLCSQLASTRTRSHERRPSPAHAACRTVCGAARARMTLGSGNAPDRP